MRFFTMTWWCGVQEGLENHPHGEYFRHLETLRERVPSEKLPTLNALLGLALHDTQLHQLQLNPAPATLHLFLENRYQQGERLTLAYSGVEQFTSESDPQMGLGGPNGYGDLGYDEVDLSAAGAFIHRMLFSSGIELTVTFREFELKRSSADVA